MPTIRFTGHMARHRPTPMLEAKGADVRSLLADAFKADAFLAGYILDEQGRLRKHVNIFVDGEMIEDRVRLSDAVKPSSEIYIMQALSGG